MDYLNENKGLVYKVVNQFYAPNGMDEEDLVQAGYIGLWKAHEKFKKNNNTKFSTYAYISIRNEILKTIQRYTKIDYGYLDENMVLPDDFETEKKVLQKRLIHKLSQDEQTIIELLYMGYTQREIANELDTTQPQICQRIRRLRVKYKNEVYL